MNTETKSETYEQYESRRRVEIQDEQVATNELNKIANKARQNARFGRFGINRPSPRTQEQLAVIAAEERTILGVNVDPATNIAVQPKPAENNAVADAGAELSDEQGKSITIEKLPENDEIDAVIGEKATVSEKVDSRHFCDLGKPFVGDAIPNGKPLADIAIPSSGDVITEQEIIEGWLKTADTVGGIATSEILHGLGLPIDRTNEMKVCQVMQNLGYTKARKAVRGLPRQTVWLKD